MKLSHLFIERPIFATVLSILITLIGGFAYFTLPVAQYPEIAPPTIVVNATYPGASAEVVADTVAAPLEQEINGVENMLYMSSQSTGDGRLVVTISFALGTDLDTAQVLVQNRVAVAEPRLPEEVRRRHDLSSHRCAIHAAARLDDFADAAGGRLRQVHDGEAAHERTLFPVHLRSRWRWPGLKASIPRQNQPTATCASSLIRSGVHGGSKTISTRTSWMPSTELTAFSTHTGISPATGHPGAVSVIWMSTVRSSSISIL